MTYKILPTKEFSKQFKKIDSQSIKRIKLKMEEIAQNPTRSKHLHYDLKNSCRFMIGKLRIVFSYDEIKKELYLETIVFGHKYKE